MNTRRRVEYGAKQGCVVRIYRDEVEDGWFDGYVVGTGPEFFALEITDKEGRLNGFACLRYADVSGCDVPAPYAAFIESALRVRGIARAARFDVDLSSLGALLRSANDRFPLVTIHMDFEDPDCCYIGRVRDVTFDELKLEEIDPGAQWLEEIAEYDLADITRIDFGGGYEEALWLVSEAERVRRG